MSLVDLQNIFAGNMATLIAFIEKQGMKCSIGEVFRTPEQAQLYAKAGKGIIDSLHCKRLAIDIDLFNKDGVYLTDTKDYASLGAFWESLHPSNRWGGRFKRSDGNHFEMQEVL